MIRMNLLDWVKVKGCLCGKNHDLDVFNIQIEYNFLSDIVNSIQNVMFQVYGDKIPSFYSILMICDENTYNTAGKKIEELIQNNPYPLNTHQFRAKSILIPNEFAVESIEDNFDDNTKLILAVGSGTINDLTRFIGYKHKIPYVSIPTAPSVDGFTSSVSSLIIGNIKKTFAAKAPHTVIVDTKILQEAPIRLKASGFGDLLGKFTARLDWHIANIINEEYICTNVADKVLSKIEETIKNFNSKKLNNDTFITHLIEGLLVSGLAISMVGSSRPASGSEHHISHFLERQVIEGKIKHLYHGETVSIGAFLIANLYDLVFSHTYKGLNKIIKSKPDRDSYELRKIRLTAAFGAESDIFIDNWRSNRPDSDQIKELHKILKTNWNNLSNLKTKILGSPDRIEKLMESAKIPYNPKKIGISNEIIQNAMICSKEMRSRYTILTLLDELGVLEYFCNRVIQEKLK